MNCIIVDDDSTAKLIVAELCNKYENINILADFSNAIDAIKFVNVNEVDLVFLDIHMPSFSGFDFIQTLKNPPKIILTTSDKNFALEAFEYHSVVDYLVKPIELDRFQKAIDKLDRFMLNSVSSSPPNESNQKKELYVNVDRRFVKINLSDINVVEAKGDYIRIKMDDKNHGEKDLQDCVWGKKWLQKQEYIDENKIIFRDMTQPISCCALSNN